MYCVWDLDGVICSQRDREHLIKVYPPKYDEFHKHGVLHSKPMPHHVELFLNCSKKFENVIITGRPDTYMDDTLHWLDMNRIKPIYIFMRPEGNIDPSPKLKIGIMKEKLGFSNIGMVYDDRADVIKAVMRNGLPGVVLK
jgi:hypothetical protein